MSVADRRSGRGSNKPTLVRKSASVDAPEKNEKKGTVGKLSCPTAAGTLNMGKLLPTNRTVGKNKVAAEDRVGAICSN